MSSAPSSATTGSRRHRLRHHTPLPAGCTNIVGGSVDVLADTAFSPAHHDGDIDFTDASGARDASGVVFQPCVGNVPPTPGKQLGRVTGGIADHFYTGHADLRLVPATAQPHR